jgi:hypothetical protein
MFFNRQGIKNAPFTQNAVPGNRENFTYRGTARVFIHCISFFLIFSHLVYRMDLLHVMTFFDPHFPVLALIFLNFNTNATQIY